MPLALLRPTDPQPGHLFTRGPGAYKIPAFNDVPLDFRVTLMKDVSNPVAVHSSKAIGEPPFFLAASAFFAIKVREMDGGGGGCEGRRCVRTSARPTPHGSSFASPHTPHRPLARPPATTPAHTHTHLHQDAIAAYRRQEKGLTAFFPFYGPASSERIRMACLDDLSAASLEPSVAPEAFQPKGSW